MRHGLPHLLFATALCFPLQALAGGLGPGEWLQRMTASLHSESYQGTFVLQREGRIDTIRVVHAAEDGGYRERLETLTGSEREILRSVDRLSVLKGARAAPDDGSEAAPHWPAGAPVFLLDRHQHYELSLQGKDRIAGFDCRLVLARSLDPFRYTHRYCLHDDTGLPLLSELYDPKGRLLERLAFTELELLDGVAEAALEPTREDAERIEVRADPGHTKPDWEDEDSLGGWLFENLPPGFTAIAATERTVNGARVASRHFVLSDGLASVSVYVEPAEEGQVFEGATRAGATHAIARALAGHQVTVVGDVPKGTVQQVMDAISYHPPRRD